MSAVPVVLKSLLRSVNEDELDGMIALVEAHGTLAIDPEGNVFPCLQWRHGSLGNVRETPLRLLWGDSPERRAAAETGRAANDAMLARGGTLSRFPFCPALVAQLTGDPLAPDEDLRARARIVETLRAERPA